MSDDNDTFYKVWSIVMCFIFISVVFGSIVKEVLCLYYSYPANIKELHKITNECVISKLEEKIKENEKNNKGPVTKAQLYYMKDDCKNKENERLKEIKENKEKSEGINIQKEALNIK